MRIQAPTALDPADIAWTGPLELPAEKTFTIKAPPPRVTLGKPVWWSAADALAGETGKQWTPPSGDRRYTLVQLSCTLHPPNGRARYDEATLLTTLEALDGQEPPRGRAHGTVAHALLPERVSVPITRKLTAGLTPELSFSEAFTLKAGELGAEISYEQGLPVVESHGRGQSTPYWTFKDHPARPLQGDLAVYVVLAAPAVSASTWLTLRLTAVVATRYGPLRFVLPAAAGAALSQAIR